MTDQADMEALTRARAIVKQFYPEMPANYSGRRVQIAIAAEAAAYARAAEVDALIADLAAQPFGGEVWGRSQALAKFTERARAILALGEAKG